MQIKILKDFKWAHLGRIHNYKADSIVEVHSRDAESMINHGYAEAYSQETKMVEHDVVEDKMMHQEVENKSEKSKSKKSK